MPDEPTTRDTRLRAILTEVSLGRLTVDEAYAQIDDLDKPGARPKPQMQSIGAGLLILAFGAIFGAVGVFTAVKSRNFSHDAAHTEGTVVRHERSGDKGSRVPVVRYEVDDRSHELRGDIGSGSPPAVHSKVTVLYKPADPSQAQIDSFMERWLFPLIFGGIGGLISLMGIVVVFRGIIGRFRSAMLLSPGGDSDRFRV